MKNLTETQKKNAQIQPSELLQTREANADFEVRSLDAMCVNESRLKHKWHHDLKYVAVGTLLGIIFVKAELISWFRIQEMFRLQSFHMYGVIGSAVAVGAMSVWLIRKFKVKTIYGEPIEIRPKTFNKGQIIGGLLFGLGWAMTGACPGPLYAQIGAGATVIVATLLSAILGTWVYGYFRDRLPH
ncbi:MAG: YeeE/YedE family protein [Chloroherpetonaceae bacterium]|nr:YeeE/YedE family protein [Chloroherpetonaceae bacterium]MDW8436593.1 YeeE/YedE thiosulfate transporter family protein [Chloroherpetonaceae bacterium]